MLDNNLNSEDEIKIWGKFLAGFLLIFLTCGVVYELIAYWPNKMPPLERGDEGAWYTNQPFNITLIENADSTIGNSKDSLHKILNAAEKQISQLKNTIKTKDTIRDSSAINSLKDSLNRLKDSEIEVKETTLKPRISSSTFGKVNRIHLNTILLILVALMGFLGNMVHIASSFTSFVGNGTFKRSWILWYCVKPFTAAALAIIVYFIIRAGFLSYGTGAAGISLYGILALSAFTGLFTDSATLKLKEVFEVIFKPKDERDDKLVDPEISVTSLSPLSIPPAGESTIIIEGTNLDTAGIKITLDGNDMKATTIAKDSIEIRYTPTPAAIATSKAVLVLMDKSGKPKITKEISIK